MYIFNAQAEYFYFFADFRLKIFLFALLDYRVLCFLRIAYMSILCLVLLFIVLLEKGQREISN